jgi:tetratricopeptide (TPR) repeat protein
MAAGAGSNDDELIGSLKTKISSNPEDWNSRWELARIYFKLAGFTKYGQEKSWLWTEPLFKRTELNKKLAPIFPQPSISCQQQLLQILDRNPEQPPALIMAGYYHDSINQKEIALWYFRRALALTPGSVEANTALADFYLDEWQPAEVLQLLSRFNSPELVLRKGIAEIQLGQYQLALGYLLQADPLPPEWQITKNLNLAKVYLALGDCNHCNALLNQGSSIQDYITISYISDQSGQSHSIPAKLFHQGDQVLECWLQTECGEWHRVRLNFLFPNQELPAVVISQNTDDIHGNEPKPETNPPKLTYLIMNNNLPLRFKINHDLPMVKTRDIEIQSELNREVTGGNADQIAPKWQWALSNDLRVWSPWQQGIASRRWRLNCGDGEKLVYVRCKPANGSGGMNIGTIRVILDTCPPELEATTWQTREPTDSRMQDRLIRFRFNEPVMPKTVVYQSGIPTPPELNPSAKDYQSEISIELTVDALQDPIDILELIAVDQAGNQSSFLFEMSATGLQPKLDPRQPPK